MSTREHQAAINQPVRGNVKRGVDRILDVPRASVYRAAAGGIGNGGVPGTPLSFDTAEYDNEGMWDTSTALYARTSGLYLVSAWVGFFNDATGYRFLTLRKNGSITNIGAVSEPSPSAATYSELSTSVPIAMNAGDYVEVVIAQTSAGALSIDPVTATSRANGLIACLISL